MLQNSIINDQTNANLNRFLNDIRKYEPLTKAEETNLILAAQAGDKQAEDMLVKHNAAYLITIAQRYHTTYVNDIVDLISSGSIGLIKAIHQVNPYSGGRLISYALKYIQSAMADFIAHDKLVYIPDNAVRIVYQAEKRLLDILHLEAENAEADARLDDHEPSPEEIMECIHGLSEESAEMFRLLYGVKDARELACVKQMAQDTMHFASKGKIA